MTLDEAPNPLEAETRIRPQPDHKGGRDDVMKEGQLSLWPEQPRRVVVVRKAASCIVVCFAFEKISLGSHCLVVYKSASTFGVCRLFVWAELSQGRSLRASSCSRLEAV